MNEVFGLKERVIDRIPVIEDLKIYDDNNNNDGRKILEIEWGEISGFPLGEMKLEFSGGEKHLVVANKYTRSIHEKLKNGGLYKYSDHEGNVVDDPIDNYLWKIICSRLSIARA